MNRPTLNQKNGLNKSLQKKKKCIENDNKNKIHEQLQSLYKLLNFSKLFPSTNQREKQLTSNGKENLLIL